MTFDRKQYHREYYKKNQDKLKKDQKTRYYKKEYTEGIELTIKRGNFIISFD